MSRDILENISALLAEGKLADLREQLCDMNVVDIAQAMESLPEDELLRIFRILPKDISADVFSYLEPDSQAQLLNLITDTELENLLDDMFLDDTVDFLEEVPANVVRRVLAKADSETRCLINRFLKYPENSAGSIMTIEMVELHDFSQSVRQSNTSARPPSTKRRSTLASASTTSAILSARSPCTRC